MSPPERPEGNLGYLFRLAHQRFRGTLDEALREHGMSAQEYGILSAFESRPELTTAELARITEVTRQTMHAAVVRLVDVRLLERRVENSRRVLLALTPAGRSALDAATADVRAVEHGALASLTPAQGRAVTAWLAGLAGRSSGA